MSKYLSVFAFFLCMGSPIATAAELSLEPIFDRFACETGEGEYGWMHHQKDPMHAETATCLFAQFPGPQYKHPFVRIKGEVVSLYLKNSLGATTKKSAKWTKTEVFASHDGRIEVTLRSRLVHDSCVGNDGSCCGQQREGELVVSSGQKSKRYQLTMWSGS